MNKVTVNRYDMIHKRARKSGQTKDVVEAMAEDGGLAALELLRVDGGASQNDLLMQLQADALQASLDHNGLFSSCQHFSLSGITPTLNHDSTSLKNHQSVLFMLL